MSFIIYLIINYINIFVSVLRNTGPTKMSPDYQLALSTGFFLKMAEGHVST